jgi:leucyl-tRNA synthetase
VWRLVEDLRPQLTAERSGMHEVITGPPGTARQSAQDLRRLTHRTIKKVSEDIEHEFQFNTAIAALMEFVNGLYKIAAEHSQRRDEGGPLTAPAAALREAIQSLILLLAPFAPHVAEELWQTMGNRPSIAKQSWPRYDPTLVVSERLTIPIQVNGKLRSKIDVPADWSQEQVVAFARQDAKLAEWLQGKSPRKVIYIEKRLLNFVV